LETIIDLDPFAGLGVLLPKVNDKTILEVQNMLKIENSNLC